MARRRGSKSGRARPPSKPTVFGSSAASPAEVPSGTGRQRAIPPVVTNRMARRIAIATGLPTLMGMAVFVASYVLVSRSILDIPPVATLLTSGACFLLGLVGLSYGVLSASWEESPGTLLGTEQLGTNLKRLGDSVRTSRQERSDRPHG